MPTINPVQSADVQGAIARAATRTGVDFDFLVAQARLESGLDPNAKAPTSSAAGLYQFIDSTWLRTLDRHGAKHGFEAASTAISDGGRVANPVTRKHLLSLRYDADASSLMVAELVRENAEGLRPFLGREPRPVELYMAHFLGLGGAKKFLGAVESNPGQSAAQLFPEAARANRSVFYSGGSPRSVGEVLAFMQDKVASAYPQGSGATANQSLEMAYASGTARNQRPPFEVPRSLPSDGRRPSMAETLRSTFGDGSAQMSRASQNVSAAYGKLKAFGL